MTQKMVFFFIFSLSSLWAIDTKLALELARSKKMTEAISRVNNIYDYINLYVMQHARTPANFAALTNTTNPALPTGYSGIVRTGFTTTDQIDFTVANNIVTFTGIGTTANTSALIRQIFQNSPNHLPNAIASIAGSNLKVDIRLKAESVQFLAKVAQVIAMSPTTIFAQSTDPGCTSVAHNGRLWYIPDSVGGFTIKNCNAAVWSTTIATKLDTSIYRTDLSGLNQIKPPAGTRGYINNGSDVNEYIYDGTNWRKVVN